MVAASRLRRKAENDPKQPTDYVNRLAKELWRTSEFSGCRFGSPTLSSAEDVMQPFLYSEEVFKTHLM